MSLSLCTAYEAVSRLPRPDSRPRYARARAPPSGSLRGGSHVSAVASEHRAAPRLFLRCVTSSQTSFFEKEGGALITLCTSASRCCRRCTPGKSALLFLYLTLPYLSRHFFCFLGGGEEFFLIRAPPPAHSACLLYIIRIFTLYNIYNRPPRGRAAITLPCRPHRRAPLLPLASAASARAPGSRTLIAS